MTMPLVDCHSHIFNAEDLPIDGFIKRLSPRPDILNGIYSVPLDRLTQWVATNAGNEAAYLAALLDRSSGLESGTTAPPPQNGSPLVSDAELDQLFLYAWRERGLIDEAELVGGLEGDTDPDAVLVEGILSPEAEADRDELEAWVLAQGDPALEEELAQEALEGTPNWLVRIRAAKEAARRWLYVLRLATKDRHLVAAEIASTYPEVALFVPALVDFEYTARDEPSSPIHRQILAHSLVSKVSIQGKIPDAPDVRIHPIVGYCPYREIANTELKEWVPSRGEANPYVPFAEPGSAGPDDRYRVGLTYDPGRAKFLRPPADPWETGHVLLEGVSRSLDFVRHAVERGGFVGVKIYPPAGYLPLGNSLRFGTDQGGRLDAALGAMYAYCTAMDVPILAHANASNGFADGYDDLAGPDGWRLVLQDFPDLRVCFGHFGHLHEVGANPSDPPPASWVNGFVSLIDDHPHVYADVGNSKFPVLASYREGYFEVLRWMLGDDAPNEQQARRRQRVMFGTDWWMNTMAPAHREYLTEFAHHYGDGFGTDARDLFMGCNALRWLGIVDEQGDPDTSNLNRQRLRDFYGTRPLPEWLA